MQTIGQFLKNLIATVEAKWGILSAELKNVLLPAALTLGTAILKAANSPIGTLVLSEFVPANLLTEFDAFLAEGIKLITEAQTIINEPTPEEQLQALVSWLQTLTADSRDAFVVKLMQLLVKLADGGKLPQNVYDSLVQAAVTDQKAVA
jgi:hypothetical protein